MFIATHLLLAKWRLIPNYGHSKPFTCLMLGPRTLLYFTFALHFTSIAKNLNFHLLSINVRIFVEKYLASSQICTVNPYHQWAFVGRDLQETNKIAVPSPERLLWDRPLDCAVQKN